MIITIAGQGGSGKSSVAKIISKKLGYKFFSGGDARGEIAKKHGITINELNKIGETERWPHAEVDDYIKELGKKEDNIVLDSWLAFHFIPHAVKIFLKVDPHIAAERIFKEKQNNPNSRGDETRCSTVDEVQKDIKEKIDSWKRGVKKWYDVDIEDMNHYDLVIDTTNTPSEKVAEKILEFVKKKL